MGSCPWLGRSGLRLSFPSTKGHLTAGPGLLCIDPGLLKGAAKLPVKAGDWFKGRDGILGA
jgi:hypothetical protein